MKMTSFFKMSVLAAGMVAAMGANAGDTGTLNVTGTLIATSCTVDASSTLDVPFDTLSAESFADVGAISEKKDIVLNLTECPISQTGVIFTANGASDATNNQLLALASDSTASGLGIAIYNKGGELIPMHSASAAAPINAETGVATINLEAAAMSTSTDVTGGAFNATTTFVLSYN